MIVTSPAGSVQLGTPNAQPLQWKSLARRGMLFSDCEAVDYLRLPPYSELDLARPDGVEKLWFAVSGDGTAFAGGHAAPISVMDLLLCPAALPVRLRAGHQGLELLLVTVTPAAVSEALPQRKPVTS